MQIRSLAKTTNPLWTGLSPSTVHRTSKGNQTIDETTQSFRQPSTKRKNLTRCLHKLGNGRRLRLAPIFEANMLGNLESRNPSSNQWPSNGLSRQTLDQQTGIRGNRCQYFCRLNSAQKLSHAVQLAAALAHEWWQYVRKLLGNNKFPTQTSLPKDWQNCWPWHRKTWVSI